MVCIRSSNSLLLSKRHRQWPPFGELAPLQRLLRTQALSPGRIANSSGSSPIRNSGHIPVVPLRTTRRLMSAVKITILSSSISKRRVYSAIQLRLIRLFGTERAQSTSESIMTLAAALCRMVTALQAELARSAEGRARRRETLRRGRRSRGAGTSRHRHLHRPVEVGRMISYSGRLLRRRHVRPLNLLFMDLPPRR